MKSIFLMTDIFNINVDIDNADISNEFIYRHSSFYCTSLHFADLAGVLFCLFVCFNKLKVCGNLALSDDG